MVHASQGEPRTFPNSIREEVDVRTCRWIIALVFLALVVPAFAQDNPVTLKWKFEKDKTFYQEMKTETKQTMKVQGSDVIQTQDMTFYFSWTPKKQDGD